MALLPYALRPRVVLRRRAIYRGVLGPSMFWKIVALGMFGRGTLKKLFGKQPDRLGTWKVGSNQFVNVINAKPVSRKERKRSGVKSKVVRDQIVAQAVADVRAKHPEAKIVVKT